jgi:hypothetical protein
MKKILVFIILCLSSFQIEAQFVKKKSISANIGYGLSTPYYGGIDVIDSGLYLQGEFVLVIATWLDLRPYSGLILTKSNGKDINQNPTPYKATSRAFLIGGKARIKAPIPWIAPFAEIGIGSSIGNFETLSELSNITKSGIIYHIPFSLGLELGRDHNFEVGLTYYFQPTIEQYAGAFAIGLSIPLK